MKIRLIRHATFILEISGQRLLVDPMLADARHYPSLTLGRSYGRNPLVNLPCPPEELLQPDGLILTHFHFDHFDRPARIKFPRQIPVICQPPDLRRLHRLGFTQIYPVEEFLAWKGIQLRRMPGRHGLGWLGKLMGPVSGFALQPDEGPCLMITGDTVWCPEFETALESCQPDVVVAYAGDARFNGTGPITLDAEGVGRVCRALPQAKILPIHMDALNHCRLGRNELSSYCAEKKLHRQVRILADGESLDLG